jgi:hypothetical protein
MLKKSSFPGSFFLSIAVLVLFFFLYACSNSDSSSSSSEDNEYDLSDLTYSHVWDGSVAAGFAGGSGTEADPYLIADPEQLAFLAQEVNGGQSYDGVFFKLTQDIVLNTGNASSWKKSAPANSWLIIGNAQYSWFEGLFDGNGYTISGVYVNSPNSNHIGLFGSVNSATLKNIKLVNSYLEGSMFVGGIVGDIQSSTITNCVNEANIVGSYTQVGGIAGESSLTTISNCSNEGTVTGHSEVGGIAGVNGIGGNVIQCANSGLISSEDGGTVGSIVGYHNQMFGGEITNCTDISNSGLELVGNGYTPVEGSSSSVSENLFSSSSAESVLSSSSATDIEMSSSSDSGTITLNCNGMIITVENIEEIDPSCTVVE